MTASSETKIITTREDWLRERRKGIGASEAAAVLGLHPYHSPLSLYFEKTSGEAIQEDTEVQEWGLLLEPAIATKYAKLTGRQVVELEPHEIRSYSYSDHIFCTPDRLFVAPDTGKLSPLQLKCSAYFNPQEELPVHWQIQEQHEMMCLGAAVASVAVLVAGRKLYWADLERNQAFIDLLRDKLEEFWDHVKRGVPPDPDGHRATTEALKRMYPRDLGTVTALPPDAHQWRDDLALIKGQIKALEAREAALENNLRAVIAGNTWATFEDGSGYSLKTTKHAGYTVEATEYRQLRAVKQLPKFLKGE